MDDEAIGWVIRLREAGDADWAAFTEWLEADPAHAAAYDEAALADADAATLLPAEPATPARPVLPARSAPARPGRRAFLGWGVAASLALVAGLSVVTLGGDGGYTVATGAGERREIALDDGSRILLNGASRVALDEDRPRFARLEEGEAMFHIVHDETRPFEVAAGDALLRDLGTAFNVVREGERLHVAVAEGEVVYNPGREARHLQPGMALTRSANGSLRVGEIDAAAVGGWRDGRLVYSGAPLAEVAADLSRNLGVAVRVAPAAGQRPFSGVIMLDGGAETVVARAAALLGLTARRDGKGWLLAMRDGAGS
ncbi:MAG: FecR family protein [Elioraea tepidiphila]